jgi:hypothetical protein
MVFPLKIHAPEDTAFRTAKVLSLRLSFSAVRRKLVLRLILIIFLVVLLLGALPTWPYSAGWGYYPSGGLGLLLLILIVLVVAKRV